MVDSTHRGTGEDFAERFEELQREVAALTKTIGRRAENGAGANGHGLGAKAERLAGKSRKAMRLAMKKGKAAISGVESTVSANPLASVAVAFGVGVLLGRLIRR